MQPGERAGDSMGMASDVEWAQVAMAISNGVADEPDGVLVAFIKQPGLASKRILREIISGERKKGRVSVVYKSKGARR